MFYVYYIENKINGKFYIGKANNPKRRWETHKYMANGTTTTYKNNALVIHKAMKKYGLNNFEFNIFIACYSEEEAYCQEKYWIEYLKNAGIILYNQVDGGLGAVSGDRHPGFGKPRQEIVKNKISETLKGRFIGNKNPNFGKKHTQESISKISKSARGRIKSQETKTKISNTLKSLSVKDRNIKYGESSFKSILKEKDVLEIKILINNGVKNIEIAKKYKVHRNTISSIKSGKNWKQLK